MFNDDGLLCACPAPQLKQDENISNAVVPCWLSSPPERPRVMHVSLYVCTKNSVASCISAINDIMLGSEFDCEPGGAIFSDGVQEFGIGVVFNYNLKTWLESVSEWELFQQRVITRVIAHLSSTSTGHTLYKVQMMTGSGRMGAHAQSVPFVQCWTNLSMVPLSSDEIEILISRQ